MENATLPSLQQIASLLLEVHNHYLKDKTGEAILTSLVSFCRDASIDRDISLFECERLKNCMMNKSTNSLGYEQFYDYLLALSQTLFLIENDKSGKKLLNKLLSKYIIPSASKLPGKTCLLLHLNENSCGEYLKYSDFITLWFSEVSLQV
jgi:hypothetical protein